MPVIPPSLLPFCAVLAATLTAQAPVPAGADEARFVENRGQWPDEVGFLLRRGPARVWCLADGVLLDLRREGPTRVDRLVVAQRLRGARPTGFAGERRLDGLEHWFVGPRRGTGCRAYASLFGRELLPGVALRLRAPAPARAGAAVEYDLVLAPGADLAGVVFDCEGVAHVEVRDAGRRLLLVTGLGAIEQRIPRTWEEGAGGVRELEARFVRRGPRSFGFVVPDRDPRRALTIDPGLDYGTFWGGGGADEVRGLRVDAKGRVLLCGSTSSSDLPQTKGSWSEARQYTLQKPRDGFVTCLERDGTKDEKFKVAWSTFLGGNDFVELAAIATDKGQRVAVAGASFATDYPVTAGAVQQARNGTSLYTPYQSDLVVTVLDKDGASLAYSTYLGGAGYELAADLGFDDQGLVTVVGEGGAGFPTTSGAFLTTAPSTSGVHAVAARIDTAKGSLLWSTYVGGSAWGRARAVALRADGAVWVGGETRSTDFPTTTAAYKPKPRSTGGDDALEGFVVRFAAAGDKLEVASFVGGSADDSVACLLVEPSGALLAGGWTRSKDLGVPKGALQEGYAGHGSPPVALRGDGFVLRFDAALSKLDAGTYYGGAGEDEITALALGELGDVWVGGQTGSADLPGTRDMAGGTYLGAGYATWRGDAFAARLTPDLHGLLAMCYHGGSDVEELRGLAWEPDRQSVLLAGTSRSGDLPVTQDALMKGTGSYYGGFLARRTPGLVHLTVKGTATPCAGAMPLEPLGPAVQDDAGFAVLARGLPRQAPGFVLVGVRDLQQEVVLGPPLQVRVVVDPNPSLILPVQADAEGRCLIPLPLKGVTQAQVAALWLQTFWVVDPRWPCTGAGLMRNTVALGLDVLTP